MKSLIHNDITRCSTNICKKRFNCARFKQIEIDTENKFSYYFIADFYFHSMNECKEFIEIKEYEKI